MTTTLTDRYIHAATRWLPGRTRTEVEAELRERIGDTVAARGDTPEAEREALEELGDPLRVAVAYAGREPALIGPRLFFPWLRLVTLLLLIVPPIIAVLAAVGAATSGDSFGPVVGSAVGAFFGVAVHVAFWTTLVFAILEWTTTEAEADTWSVDQLPESVKGVSLADTIASVVMVAVMIGLIVWQHVGSPFFEDGERIPMADPALWSWYLPLVIFGLVLELLHALWIQRSGWTWPAAWANTGISVLFAVPTVYLLLKDAIINPDLIAHLNWDPEIVTTTTQWVAAGVVLVSLWEIFDGFRKARLAS